MAGRSITGLLRWSYRGVPSGCISYTCDMRDPAASRLEFSFTNKGRWTLENSGYVQHVRLSFTLPYFGGKRWWMHCPHDGNRVGKLYCPEGSETFASRSAWDLGYRSQRIADGDKQFEQLFRIQDRLGGPVGWGLPIGRPKGMWRRTYERLEQRYYELEAQCSPQMMAMEKLMR